MNLKQVIVLVINVLYSVVSLGQDKFTISGYIKEASSGEAMIGAAVYVSELQKGSIANQYGFYSITLPAGEYNIRYSFIGFNDHNEKVNLDKDIRLNVELSEDALEIEEVVIEGEKSKNTEGTQMGTVKLKMASVRKIPAFLGEVDIMKTIQFLPGVSSAGEGNTGFYVRGGGPDQNLILLDEATVYNASHLFGFFSVFNGDAVKDVKLIKGGMPANYGGRLASVLDITMKEGNNKEYHAQGGIGVISSRLTFEGPIVKNKSSFILTGRRTYIDVLTKPFISETNEFYGSGYYFYDFNAKVNWQLSDKDRLYLSGYFGRDVFSYNNAKSNFKVNIPWGNATGSLRWNHLFGDKLFLNTTLVYSEYDFEFGAQFSQFESKLKSGIRDWNLKADFNYFPSVRHTVKFGVQGIQHKFTPSSMSAKSGDTEFDAGEIQHVYGNEFGIYALDEWDITERIKINGGFRLSIFQHIGPFTRFIKNDKDQTTSEIKYDPLKPIKTYIGPEPRISARFKVDKQSSLKLGVTHNYQFVHLSTLDGVSLPTDVWFPSTDKVKPQIGTQYALGYFRNFKEETYESSVEIYYKDLQNLIEYKEGSQPSDNINDNVDNYLTFGTGYSYGAEFFFKKRLGDLTGWVGYTWSKTFRKFPEINEGREFSAKFDRRHDLSVIATYDLTKRWSFGAAFVYATGSSLTLPIARYYFENNIITEFGDRNWFRMPAYHRADISVTYNGKEYTTVVDPDTGKETKKKKRFVHGFNFSIYNVYNRANPYFIYLEDEGNLTQGTLDLAAFQVSLFPILPSITWNFKF